MFTDINIKPFAGFIQKIRAAAFLFGNFCGGFQKEAKRDAIYKWVKFLCRSAEDAIPLLWVQGRSALLGSRGKAHWRVKGGSPYRVKGETPCPAFQPLPEGEAVQLGLPEEWLEAGKP